MAAKNSPNNISIAKSLRCMVARLGIRLKEAKCDFKLPHCRMRCILLPSVHLSENFLLELFKKEGAVGLVMI